MHYVFLHLGSYCKAVSLVYVQFIDRQNFGRFVSEIMCVCVCVYIYMLGVTSHFRLKKIGGLTCSDFGFFFLFFINSGFSVWRCIS